MAEDIPSILAQAKQARRDQRIADARDLYQRAADAARASPDGLALVHALRHLSELNRELGALERALADGEEAVRLCRATAGTTTLDIANAERVRALAHQLLGHAAPAERGWRDARALYGQAGVAAGVAEADRMLAALPARDARAADDQRR